MPIILNKMDRKPEHDGLPIIFLLGPDQGGGDWQSEMYDRLLFHAQAHDLGEFVAAIPKRYPEDHPMRLRVAKGTTSTYTRQLPWEREYIERAALSASSGCVAIWLPEESKTEPRNDGQPYGRDTRGELGELRGWTRCIPWVRFVIGGQPGFPGIDVIRDNFSYAMQIPCQVYPTLDEVAWIAVRIAKRTVTVSERRSE